jgi:hypothetical protein
MLRLRRIGRSNDRLAGEMSFYTVAEVVRPELAVKRGEVSVGIDRLRIPGPGKMLRETPFAPPFSISGVTAANSAYGINESLLGAAPGAQIRAATPGRKWSPPVVDPVASDCQ